jgi:hypothetical protein
MSRGEIIQTYHNHFYLVGQDGFKVSCPLRDIPYCSCNDFPIPSFSTLMEEHGSGIDYGVRGSIKGRGL